MARPVIPFLLLASASVLLVSTAGADHWRALEVAGSLVTLYEIWERPQEEARWRALLDAPVDAAAPAGDG